MDREGAWYGILKSLLPCTTTRSRPTFSALPRLPLPRLEHDGAGRVLGLVPSRGATGEANPDLPPLAKQSSLALHCFCKEEGKRVCFFCLKGMWFSDQHKSLRS